MMTFKAAIKDFFVNTKSVTEYIKTVHNGNFRIIIFKMSFRVQFHGKNSV